jgi:ubiquinone/menaquinone biosynthesis C-methylase UbiE
MNAKKNHYVLKDKEKEEFVRLGFQHQVWQKETVGVCMKAGFGLGQTLLDLGCGPGFLNFDLSKLVGEEGRVIAVDNSEAFIKHMEAMIAAGEYHNVRAQLMDMKSLELPPASIDGAIARWLLMFIDNPDIVIEKVANALRPNAVFAVMEYFQFRSMTLLPYSKAFEKVYHAVYELIKSHGGNADIGGKMPQLLSKHGLEILDIYPIFRIGKSGSQLWSWLEMTGRNHDNVVEKGLITQRELEEYYQDWAEHSKNPNAFFTAPPVFVTIARKL